MSCESCDKVSFLPLFSAFLFGRQPASQPAEREKQPPELPPGRRLFSQLSFRPAGRPAQDLAGSVHARKLQAYNKYFALCLQFLTA